MKTITESINESNTVSIVQEKLTKVSKLLNKAAIKKDIKEYNTEYKVPMPHKRATGLWDDLFHILAARLEPSMSYDEMLDIVKEYVNDDLDYSLPDKEIYPYQYKSNVENWEKAKYFTVDFGRANWRIFFMIMF